MMMQKPKFWLHLSRRLGRLGPLGPLTHRPASPFHGFTPTWQAWQAWQMRTLSCALEFQLLCQLAGLKRACSGVNEAAHLMPFLQGTFLHVIIAYSTLKHHLATGPTTTAHADPAQSELALSSLGGYNSRAGPVQTIPENISQTLQDSWLTNTKKL